MTEAPDLETIVSALKREYEDAEDFYSAEIQPEQEAANRYYEALPFGDEDPNRSQIVLPIVQEVIDYAVPSIKRAFLQADRIVEIEATSDEDERGADEATVALHYNFMREQDGPSLITTWLQSGLLERIGVMKTVRETEEVVTRRTVSLDDDMFVALKEGLIKPADFGIKPDEEIEGETREDDGSFSMTLKRTQVVKRYIDVPIPLCEYRVSRRARHEDQADYQAHVCLKTRSDLIEMGFDREQVDELPIASNLDGAAYAYMDWSNWRDTADMPHELQTVLLCEEYARMDVDGDGIAERVKAFRVEDEILIDVETGKPSIETITEQPFVVFCPFPRAHRLIGNSLASKAMDLQRVESVNARQMNDGMYLANMPRPLIDMSNEYAATTIEDVLRPIAGSPIRYKGQPPIPYQAGLDVSKSLQVAEYWKGERESRTGITRLNQGLDAETLNKTASGQALISAQGQQLEEDMARNFGDAVGRLFAKKVRLMRAEGARFPIKLEKPIRAADGTVQKYGMADASNWPEDFRMIIRVGLGTGRKDQRIQYLFALGSLMQQGFEAGVVDKSGLFRYGSEVVRAMQLGQGEDFFINPAEQGEEVERPDPEMAKVQAQAQAEQMKMQAKAQGDQMNAEVKLQTGAMNAEADAQIARERMAQEAQLRREEMATEAELKAMGMVMDAEIKRTTINDAKPGGSLAK